MHILHINSEIEAVKIDEFINKGSNVFIMVYMEGCGPCNATRPEWSKIESALKKHYAKNNKLVVVDINKDFISNVRHIGNIDGFPTMKYIGNYGKTVETYENSYIKQKDRSVTSFINWIESKINNTISTNPTSSAQDVYDRLTIIDTTHKHNQTKRNKNKRNKNKRNKNKCNNKNGSMTRRCKHK